MTEYSDPRETEIRLCRWLNSNQPKREQMCLALLPILGPFSGCQPRRPKGGRDGARDIEAVYENSVEVWGAVGFKNDASNSNEHRKWAQEKFEKDLNSALAENPDLKGFVFLTNVDLTPTIRDSLKQSALAKGLEFIEVYDLEILRHYLDSTEGLIVRLQFLGLPMTPTEQAVLVNRYGTQLQNAITHGFDSVERMLQRLEFLAEIQLPLREIHLKLRLSKRFAGQDIPDAAAMLRVHSIYQNGESYVCLFQTNPEHPLSDRTLATVSSFWRNLQPSHLVQCGRTQSGSPSPFFGGTCRFRAYRSLAVISLDEFILDSTIMIYCTPNLQDYVTHVELSINDYLVLDEPVPDRGVYLPDGLKWPDESPKELTEVEWASLSRYPLSVDVSQKTLTKKL